MKILVTFAVQTEFAPWRRFRGFRRVGSAPRLAIYETQAGQNIVQVALTGMGPENARRAMCAVLEGAPDVCISAGLAGALKPVHRPGEVLAARQVGDVRGSRLVESSTPLLAVASECGAKIVDLFLTSDKIVATSAEKRRLGRFADAVEMESETVLSAALSRGIPGVAIRAVGDEVSDDLPYSFERASDAQGRIRLARVFAQVARRPHRLPGLLRLGRQCRATSTRLAQFLDVYVGMLAPQTKSQEMESAVAAT